MPIKKILPFLIIGLYTLFVVSCSSSHSVSGKAKQFESVQIYLTDGRIVEGLFIGRDAEILKYVDNKSHQLVTLNKNEIKSIKHKDMVYDYEAYPIKETEISNKKGSGKTVAYGFGGFVLGGAVGFGIGVILVEAASVPPIYPTIAGGLGGGIYFGHVGSRSDRFDAIEEIREHRLEKSKENIETDIQQKKELIEKEKQRIEELKKTKEKKD